MLGSVFQTAAPGLPRRLRPVEPPTATSEAVSAGGSPTAKSFSPFTDPDRLIKSYATNMVNVVGSTSASGSGLGPYTFSGAADGDAFTLELYARDAANKVIATAVHTVSVGAAGGTSLWDLSMEVIDLTDGSWTLYDPDGLVDTTYGTNGVTHSAGFNTVQWNALGSGSSNYNWSAGSTHRAPRWYKLLQISTNQVTNQTTLLFSTRLAADTSINDFNQQVVVGPCLDPTSVTSTDIDGTGGKFEKTTAGHPGYGTWQVNNATVSTHSNNDYSVCAVLRSSNSLGAGAYVNVNSSNEAVTSNSRFSNQNSAATGTVNAYLMVGVGPRNNTDTISAGDQQKFKAAFRAIALEVT